MLESYIRNQLKQKDILLMTHIVLGYPDFETSVALAETMVAAGVDIMELQIPFSEPIADGPMILKANEQALQNGATVNDCLNTAKKITSSCSIPFLFMSYYNILYQFGVEHFADTAGKCGIKGMIVPDAPPEEAPEYIAALKSKDLSPIQFFTPNTSYDRMCHLARVADGFVYCVARKGVTGLDTNFSKELDDYLGRCRQATSLPLALGFGIKDRDDISYLKGKVDVAVIGSNILRVFEAHGVTAVGDYINALNEA